MFFTDWYFSPMLFTFSRDLVLELLSIIGTIILRVVVSYHCLLSHVLKFTIIKPIVTIC